MAQTVTEARRTTRGGAPARDHDESDGLRHLMDAVASRGLLSAREEVELARRIERGDQDAKRRLVECNIRLVLSIARRYQGFGLPLPDLVQEGSLGLMRAAERFDHRRGFKFSTYATWWVRQSISRAVANQGRTVRLPVHVNDQVRRVTAAEAGLSSRLGRDPTDDEVAAAARVPAARLERLREARSIGGAPVSLDRPIDDDAGATLGDLLAEEPGPEPWELADRALVLRALAAALGCLSWRERLVLGMRYGLFGQEPATFERIGLRLGVTAERVRQVERTALARVRCDEDLRDVATAP